MGGGGGGNNSGAEAQARAQERAIDLQKSQWEQTQAQLKPYMQVGQPALQSLQNLSSLGGQTSALNSYYNSDQFKDLANQARYQQLSSAEATGGLGSSATSNALATIAPTLGQNWLSGQLQNYSNLTNIGMNAATGQASAGQNYANNTSSLLQGLGQIQGSAGGGPSKAQSAVGGAAAGAAMGTAIMPGWGTAIGAGVGLLGSLF